MHYADVIWHKYVSETVFEVPTKKILKEIAVLECEKMLARTYIFSMLVFCRYTVVYIIASYHKW